MNIYENLKFREDFIKEQFLELNGYELDLENPKSFNEKIQWMKLYYNDPLMTQCADKYLARDYVKNKIGEEYLVPLLGVWNSPEDINFDLLPNQFVLKVNWGSGQNIIVKDKSLLNVEEVISKLKNWFNLFNNTYYYSYEWQYKNIKPKIICEKYIDCFTYKSLPTYGFYCFNGEVKFIHTTIFTHTPEEAINFYDIDWNLLNVKWKPYFSIKDNIYKPVHLYKMMELCRKLTSDFVHCRVDFICFEDKIYFGELTFTSCNGTASFEPIEFDYKFGEYFKLPEKKKIENIDYINTDLILEQLSCLEYLAIDYKKMDSLCKYYEQELNNLRNEYNSDTAILKQNKFKSFNLFSICISKEKIVIFIFGIKITIKKKFKY